MLHAELSTQESVGTVGLVLLCVVIAMARRLSAVQKLQYPAQMELASEGSLALCSG